MESQPPINEWDQVETVSSGQVRRAAWFVWGVGMLQAVLFGCGAASSMVAAAMPYEDLLAEMQKQGHDTTPFEQMGPEFFAILAGTLFFLGFLPGVAYLVLGFFVHKGNQRVMEFTLLLLLTQALVIGLVFLTGAAGSLFALDPIALTSNVLLFGTPFAVLCVTILQVYRARQEVSNAIGPNIDPWNNP